MVGPLEGSLPPTRCPRRAELRQGASVPQAGVEPPTAPLRPPAGHVRRAGLTLKADRGRMKESSIRLDMTLRPGVSQTFLEASLMSLIIPVAFLSQRYLIKSSTHS